MIARCARRSWASRVSLSQRVVHNLRTNRSSWIVWYLACVLNFKARPGCSVLTKIFVPSTQLYSIVHWCNVIPSNTVRSTILRFICTLFSSLVLYFRRFLKKFDSNIGLRFYTMLLDNRISGTDSRNHDVNGAQ